MKLNHMDIVKRAWRILWSYRALWVFGIILALTTSNGGGNGGGSASFSGDSGNGFELTAPPEIQRELGQMGEALGRLFEQVFTEGIVPQRIIGLGIGLVCLVGILIVVGTIARYVAENALIKLVDDHETTGEHRRVREGFRLGWSRSAFRQWLIGLVITVPLVIAFLVALGVTALPALAWLTENVTLGIFGTIGAIGLFFLLIFATIIVATVATVVVKLAWRATALEDLGVFPSIGHAWAMLRSNFKDVALMWLVMFGINLAFVILAIPVVLLLIAISGVSGGLLFLAARGLAGLFVSGVARWIVAGIIGGAVFILVLALPLTFLGALSEVFSSTVWTLAYRELAATDVVAVEVTQPEPTGAAAPAEPASDDTAA